MRKVLVSGGAGFLGSHLCEKLLKNGNTVIALDNLYTGSIGNIEHLSSNPRFTFIEADVRNVSELEVDYIFNLASPASPVHYQSDPILTLTTNFIGSLNLLELARKNRCGIFQASTSEIYGDPEIHPQVETYWGNVNPIGVRSCYDEGKRSAETLFFDFNRVHNVEIKVVRIFNTYGPRMASRDGRVVSNFVTRAIAGETIEIYGSGNQTRSFCYVDDLIDGFIKISELPREITGPFNLGNPNEFTMKELAEKVVKLTNSHSAIKYLPLPQDDPRMRRPDIRLVNKATGWEPRVNLDEGLARTISYFKELDSR